MQRAIQIAFDLKDLPEEPRVVPDGVVAVPTGQYPSVPGEAKMVPEFFYREAIPPPEVLQPPPPVLPVFEQPRQ